MNRIFLCLSAFVLILASCSQEPEEKVVPPETVSVGNVLSDISEPVLAGSQTTVTLTGLEKGELYGIYPKSSTGRTAKAGTVSNLIRTKAGTYLYLADDSSDLTFEGSEVGISDVGTLAFIKYRDENFDDDFMIDTGSDAAKLTLPDGSAVYDEYYSVDLSGFEDRSELALIAIGRTKKQSSASSSHEYAVIAGSEYKNDETSELKGVMNLTEYSNVKLFNQLKFKGERRVAALKLLKPVVLELNRETDLISPAVYEIKANGAEDKELVLEFEFEDGYSTSDIDVFTNNPAARTSENGNHVPYIAPFYVKEDGKVLAYVGKISSDTIFDFYITYQDMDQVGTEVKVGKITLREIKPEEKEHIEVISTENMTQAVEVSINKDQPFKLIIFDDENLTDVSVSYDCDVSEADMSLKVTSTEGNSVLQSVFRSGKVLEITDGKKLESLSLMRWNVQDTGNTSESDKVTITITPL